MVTVFINKPQLFRKFVSAFDFLFFRKRHRHDRRWCKTFILCKQVSVFCNHIFSYTSIKKQGISTFFPRRHIWASCYLFNLEICIKCTKFSRESWYNSTLTICNRKCYNLSIDISAQNGDDFFVRHRLQFVYKGEHHRLTWSVHAQTRTHNNEIYEKKWREYLWKI